MKLSSSRDEYDEEDEVYYNDNAEGNQEGVVTLPEGKENDELTLDPTPQSSSKRPVVPHNIGAVYAGSMARNPCMHLCTALFVTMVLGFIGLFVGEFSVSVDNAGWTSRGTLIANRESQLVLITDNIERLMTSSNGPNNTAWEDLLTNIQPGWDDPDSDEDDGEDERRLTVKQLTTTKHKFYHDIYLSSKQDTRQHLSQSSFRIVHHDKMNRKDRFLQNTTSDAESKVITSLDGITAFEGCSIDFYTSPTSTMWAKDHLWPIWRVVMESTDVQTIPNVYDPRVIESICLAEQNTQRVIVENDLCYHECKGMCLPPYSLVFFVRMQLGDTSLQMDCSELSTLWSDYLNTSTVSVQLQNCLSDIITSGHDGSIHDPLPLSCPFGFHPLMVNYINPDETDTQTYQYASSIFPTNFDDDSIDRMYDIKDQFDRSSPIPDVIESTYDTRKESLLNIYIDVALGRDMILAMGSGVITVLAMVVHTKSLWISGVGLLQVIMSFPLAYFVYALIGRLDFFPFLNFIAVFVGFALGADDIFVAVDKWKNARLQYPTASTEFIAKVALPDAAAAMFLTTFTTAVAFFSTIVCPVAPLKLFAIFNGLLITFNYILCVFYVFPALVLYDKWTTAVNSDGSAKKRGWCHCCVSFTKKTEAEKDEPQRNRPMEASVDKEGGELTDDNQEESTVLRNISTDPVEHLGSELHEHDSFVHRLLLGYFRLLYRVRYAALVVIIATFILSSIIASKLALPENSDVRIVSDSIEMEKNAMWRSMLLSNLLRKRDGSQGHVVWGVRPADTGDHNNPDSFTTLVLDDTFDPSSQDAQIFLSTFCSNFFATDYAEKINESYVCPIDSFNQWLQEQSNSTSPDLAYVENCDGATKLPMPSEAFNGCVIGYAQTKLDMYILEYEGQVRIIWFPYQSRVRFDSAYDDLDREWNAIEKWMKEQNAPEGVNGMYSSSEDFWWYDTNGGMLSTAFQSAGISLATCAVVVFISMRSISLMFYSMGTVMYILVVVTAVLRVVGWTLGFLESVCFAILIGISCDFVLHLGHAYRSPLGQLSAFDRSRFALLHMGPSILAAAFTTICSAVVMLFTVVTFFQKFATILFATMLAACIGTFFTFLTLLSCFGPTEPTYFVDKTLAQIQTSCCGGSNKNDENTNGLDVSGKTEARSD